MLSYEDYARYGIACGKENAFAFCPKCGRELVIAEVEGTWRPVCPGCGWIHYLNPPPVVCAVPYRGKEVLLIKRAVEPRKGTWALPGGFMEVGEAPVDACLRELEEETGIVSVGEVELVGVEYQPSRRYGSVVVIGYAIEVLTPEEAGPGDDAEEVAWFSRGDRPRMPFESFERVLRRWEEKAGLTSF